MFIASTFKYFQKLSNSSIPCISYCSGFLLIELLVALGVFLSFFMALNSYLEISARGRHGAVVRVEAVNEASNILEELIVRGSRGEVISHGKRTKGGLSMLWQMEPYARGNAHLYHVSVAVRWINENKRFNSVVLHDVIMVNGRERRG